MLRQPERWILFRQPRQQILAARSVAGPACSCSRPTGAREPAMPQKVPEVTGNTGAQRRRDIGEDSVANHSRSASS
jgi:hypothetical protein